MSDASARLGFEPLVRTFVSVRDWIWFWIIIKGDEFHKSLSIDMKGVCSGSRRWDEELDRVERLRERAHRLDLKYRRNVSS